MLFRPDVPPPQAQNDLRHFCRFPKCRSKLPKPVSSALDAFCTVGCIRGFYRGHCRVCKRGFERKTERAKTCGRRECQTAFRRDPIRFSGSRYGDAPVVVNPSKKPIKPGVKIVPLEGPTVWQTIAGPTPSKVNLHIPLDPDLIARLARYPAHVLMVELDAKARRRAARTAVFKRRTPPVNILGGFSFPGAPEIDFDPPATNMTASASQPTPSTWAPTTAPTTAAPVGAAGVPDLSIPEFLRRPSAALRPAKEVEEPSSMPGDGSNINLGR
jgi:hypothetical protein